MSKFHLHAIAWKPLRAAWGVFRGAPIRRYSRFNSTRSVASQTRTIIEPLEARRCLAAAFVESFRLGDDVQSARTAEAADFDSDGDLDVVGATNFGTVVYENLDGMGFFGPATLVDADLNDAAIPIDVDGDDDLDIVAASNRPVCSPSGCLTNRAIKWFENDGTGVFGAGMLVSEGLGAEALFVHDFDNDGVDDLLASDGFRLAFYKNLGGQFSFPVIIDERGGGPFGVGDVDGNGYKDIVFQQYGNVIYNSNGEFSQLQPGRGTNQTYEPIDAIDIDSDGDLDFVGRTLLVNTNGAGEFETIAGGSGIASAAVDFDNDGIVEIVIGRRRSRHHYELRDGSHKLSHVVIDDAEFRYMTVTDINSDGQADVLVANSDSGTSRPAIFWFDFTDTEQVPHPVSHKFTSFSSIESADFDGDGYMDAIGFERHQFLFFRNSGDGTFALDASPVVRQEIRAFNLADMDSDGDPDILYLSQIGRDTTFLQAEWLENDGDGTFDFKARPVAKFKTRLSDPLEIQSRPLAVDVDQDGDIDVFVRVSDEVFWLDSDSGNGQPSVRVIASDDDGRHNDGDLLAKDVDDDGDIDIVTATELLLNQGANVSPEHLFVHSVPYPVGTPIDIDLDGDIDKLFGSMLLINNGTEEWDEHTLRRRSHELRSEVLLSDADNDGDLDIFLNGEWHEQLGGFEFRHHNSPLHPFAVRARYAVADFNGDGRVDLAFAGRLELSICSNRIPGDSNGDGRFDSADIVTAFKAGKYRSRGSIATFDEGDWDGDGDFDQRDLAYVFQNGEYEPTAAKAAAIDSIWDRRNRKIDTSLTANS